MASRDGALPSAGTLEFYEAGASGRVQLTADHVAVIRTEADCGEKRLAINGYPDSGT